MKNPEPGIKQTAQREEAAVEETGDGKLRSLLWPGKHPRPFQGAFTSSLKSRTIGRLCPGTGLSTVGKDHEERVDEFQNN